MFQSCRYTTVDTVLKQLGRYTTVDTVRKQVGMSICNGLCVLVDVRNRPLLDEVEDSSLLEHDVLLGEWLPTFRRHYINAKHREPLTQRHIVIPEDLNSQQHSVRTSCQLDYVRKSAYYINCAVI
jgi:hypothetical protein